MRARGGHGGTKTRSSTAGCGPVFCATPEPSQEFPGKSRGHQSRWLNHPGGPIWQPEPSISNQDDWEGGLGKSPHLSHQQLEFILFFLQLRLSCRLQRWFLSSRWLRRGRHHRLCCRPGMFRALPAHQHHRRHAESRSDPSSEGGLRSTSLLPLRTYPICHGNQLWKLGISSRKWARSASG